MQQMGFYFCLFIGLIGQWAPEDRLPNRRMVDVEPRLDFVLTLSVVTNGLSQTASTEVHPS